MDALQTLAEEHPVSPFLACLGIAPHGRSAVLTCFNIRHAGKFCSVMQTLQGWPIAAEAAQVTKCRCDKTPLILTPG